MKIKKIRFEQHPRLGDLELSFLDSRGNAADTIIFAGENGTGKTAILEAIAELSNMNPSSEAKPTSTTVVFQLEHSEAGQLASVARLRGNLSIENDAFNPVDAAFVVDHRKINSWAKFRLHLIGTNGEIVQTDENFFSDEVLRATFIRTAFSPVEINFHHGTIASVTTRDLDRANETSLRATANLPTEVAQLLVDIQALDDAAIGEWVRANPGSSPPAELIDQRVSRFRRAFAGMFPNKSYKGVRNSPSGKEAVFDELGREVTLNQLSSGEKQIVFRGSFLLSNQKNLSGSLILVDEPEISLHPNWQLKILDYYRSMFVGENSVQTCQLFFATHSPFIIHSIVDEHVVVLKRGEDGSIQQVEDAKFPNVGPAKIVEKAFEFQYVVPQIARPIVVFVEGDSDKEILEQAWEKLFSGTARRFELVVAYACSQIRTILARGDLLRRSQGKHFVGLFDFDSAYTDWKGLKWPVTTTDVSKGLTKSHATDAGTAMLLPVPVSRQTFASEQLGASSTLSIEFLFEDADILPEFLDEKPLPQSTSTLKIFRDSRKIEFAALIKDLPASSFENFRGLLNRLNAIDL